MTIIVVRVSEGKLVVKERTILTEMSKDVVETLMMEEMFLRVDFKKEGSRHIISLGTLKDVWFMVCFQIKLW